MNLREWLKETYTPIGECGTLSFGINDDHLFVRPRIVCKDDFSFSCQAGYFLHSLPRVPLKNGDYDAVEIGFPSKEDPLIKEYANDKDYLNTVYPYVPVQVVEEMIKKHGGMIDEQSRYV